MDEYYISDYDLSAFTAHKLGLGFRYAPLYGLGRFKTPFGGRVAKFSRWICAMARAWNDLTEAYQRIGLATETVT